MFIVHLLCFQKPVLSYTFTFFLTCSVFGTIPHPPSTFAHLPLFFLYQITPNPFHKSYLQSKTFLNIPAVPSNAVFCSNAVLITTPSSSMYLFSFFGVLPSAPNATGMTLMLLMFHILLISLLSSWHLSMFSFTNSQISR